MLVGWFCHSNSKLNFTSFPKSLFHTRVTHLSASSTCNGTFSAPSGGSLAKRYELLGLGEDAYLGPPAGSSGDTFSSVSAAPPEEHLDDGLESAAPGIIGYVGDAEWLLLLLLPLPPLSCPS